MMLRFYHTKVIILFSYMGIDKKLYAYAYRNDYSTRDACSLHFNKFPNSLEKVRIPRLGTSPFSESE